MDGLSSAFIAKTILGIIDKEVETITVPMQYGMDINKEISKAFKVENYENLNFSINKLYFVDFSLKKKEMLDISLNVLEKVIILDHHESAMNELKSLKSFEEFEIIFDMKQSGAKITYNYFKDKYEEFIGNDDALEYKEIFNKLVFDYIEDRDLWNWELNNSRAVSSAAKLLIKSDDLESFRDYHSQFNIWENVKIGDTILAYEDKIVASKTKEKKLTKVKINDIEMHMVNATELISEIGNEICKKMNTPSIMYFILPDGNVVLSMRSLKGLSNVSEIAKSFGGGGHPQASGCTVTMKQLSKLIKTKKLNAKFSITGFISNLFGK
jgi:nanoRNase/pAp phosphatase (c-di-AMP/oligoRNAs hydrolase)